MHALIQAVSNLIAAMALAAFAHFGMTLKFELGPPPAPAPVVQRIPTSAEAQPGQPRRPCPFAADARRT